MKTQRISTLLAMLAIAALAVACGSGGASVPSAPPEPPVPGAVGTWTFTIETPMGTQNPEVVISGDDSGLMGTFGSPAGTIDMSTVSADGDMLEFSVTIDIGGQDLTLNFSGTVEGDNISGSFGSDFGDFAATAVRNTE